MPYNTWICHEYGVRYATLGIQQYTSPSTYTSIPAISNILDWTPEAPTGRGVVLLAFCAGFRLSHSRQTLDAIMQTYVIALDKFPSVKVSVTSSEEALE